MSGIRKPRRPKKLVVRVLDVVSRRWNMTKLSFEVPRRDFKFEIENGKAHISFSVDLKKAESGWLDPRFLEKSFETLKKNETEYLERLLEYRKKMSEWRRRKKLTSFE